MPAKAGSFTNRLSPVADGISFAPVADHIHVTATLSTAAGDAHTTAVYLATHAHTRTNLHPGADLDTSPHSNADIPAHDHPARSHPSTRSTAPDHL